MPLFFSNATRADHLKRARSKSGFTLTEIMIALVIMVIVSAGVLMMTTRVRQSMNQALTRNTAFDAAQGFLDQIKCMPFGTIQTAMNNPGTPFMNGTTAIALYSGGAVTAATVPGANPTTRTTVIPNPTPATYYTPVSLPLNPGNGTPSLSSMSTVPGFGILVTLVPVTDTPIASSGAPNAILVTVNFEYKYLPTDAGYAKDSVAYLVPNI